MKLNVVIPMFNEEGNVDLLYKSLTDTLEDINYELIFINDGSKDKTYQKLKAIYEKDSTHVRVINFSRNFGKDAAIYAGLYYTKAEYSVIIDGDCQQNPKYLINMMHFLDNNLEYDQIAMINRTRPKESFINKILKSLFYSFINKISDTKFVKGASDFRMFRSYVVDAISTLSENNRFSKGIFSWIGFNTYYMDYNVENRNSGTSSYNLINQFKYAFSGIINFSIKPLRIATVTGSLFALGAFIYLIITLVQTFISGIEVPGYASLISLISLLGGLQLMAIGILGEYIAKTYLESKKRPIYIAKNKLGFNDENVL